MKGVYSYSGKERKIKSKMTINISSKAKFYTMCADEAEAQKVSFKSFNKTVKSIIKNITYMDITVKNGKAVKLTLVFP